MLGIGLEQIEERYRWRNSENPLCEKSIDGSIVVIRLSLRSMREKFIRIASCWAPLRKDQRTKKKPSEEGFSSFAVCQYTLKLKV